MLVNPVFLHGWAFSSKVFDGFRGIKIDLPYHGSSKLGYGGMEELVDDIALTLPSKHDLVGWSMGASLAMLLALKYPSKVNRLFLIGATAHFGGAWSRANIRAFMSMVKREGYGGIRKFRGTAYGGAFEDSLELEPAIGMLSDYIELNLELEAPFIRKEVFLIHGLEDEVVPPQESLKLFNLLKGAKLLFLSGGHFPIGYEEEFIAKVFKGG